MMDGDGLKELLSLVSRPVRYLGSEINSIRKDPSKVKFKFCLAFPDVYEVGMSHLGVQILYHILNGKRRNCLREGLCPMGRYGAGSEGEEGSSRLSRILHTSSINSISLGFPYSTNSASPMSSICSISPVSLCWPKDRDERFPLIIAGGPTTFNPAPVADFFDAIVIGDGEEVVLEIGDLALRWKEANGKKEDLLKSLSQLEGVYVPSLHREGKESVKELSLTSTGLLFRPARLSLT